MANGDDSFAPCCLHKHLAACDLPPPYNPPPRARSQLPQYAVERPKLLAEFEKWNKENVLEKEEAQVAEEEGRGREDV